MMSLIGIISLLVVMTNQLIITTACSSVPLTDCNASGYCTLSSDQLTCQNLLCYMINEVGACRDVTSIAYSGGACQALTQFDLRYDNVCAPSGILDYAFIRLPIDKTGSPLYSTTGMTIAEVTGETVQSKRNNLLNQLFSYNLQTATNTQLIDILGMYVGYATEIIAQASHPYYLEKAIFQALQNLRDDTSTSKNQAATLTKVWLILDTLLIRLQTYRKHYASSYFFINFAHTQFSRTYLSVKGQYSMFSVKWLTSYTLNGYVQIVTFAMNQFPGFPNALSDGIIIKTTSTDGNPYTTLTYTLVWLITDTTKITCGIGTTAYLHVINDINAMTETTSVDIHTKCSSSTHRCDIPNSSIPAGQAYYIACVV